MLECFPEDVKEVKQNMEGKKTGGGRFGVPKQ